MLVGFDHDPEHFRRLQTLLVNELQTDAQQLRERMLDDLVEFLPLLSGLESVYTADGQQALQTGVDGVCIVGAQQLEGDVQETRPLLGEIMLKDFLKKRNQLSPNIRRRGCQGGNQPLTEPRFLLLGNRCAQRTFFDRGPTTINAVLQVNTG